MQQQLERRTHAFQAFQCSETEAYKPNGYKFGL
jgi:hypothetical protein